MHHPQTQRQSLPHSSCVSACPGVSPLRRCRPARRRPNVQCGSSHLLPAPPWACLSFVTRRLQWLSASCTCNSVMHLRSGTPESRDPVQTAYPRERRRAWSIARSQTARSIAPAVAPPCRPRLPSVRRQNQSSPLARRSLCLRHGHGTEEANCLYCDCQTIRTKIVHTLFV